MNNWFKRFIEISGKYVKGDHCRMTVNLIQTKR